ncbi:MAG: hypothetical protein FWC40_03690 [Proteobacteria bacterium]|nr:hypothetical protein [Pseudomonadota bacterium]
MRRLFLFIFFPLCLSACGEDTITFPMCYCERDEICIHDKCYATTPDIAPAPDAQPTDTDTLSSE